MKSGLATLRKDGFVSLQVAERMDSGWFTTIPMETKLTSLKMDVNAEGLAGGEGRITVELTDGGKVLAAGAALNQDGVAVPIRWGEGKTVAVPDSRRLQLRFRLAGRARLYSFTFR